MLYMNSQATTDGVLTLNVTFRLGTNPDLAQQMVQNRVSQAESRLPAVTRQLGITTVKSSPNITLVVHLLSPNDRYDTTYLRNFGVLNVKDRLARIRGVGQVQIWGAGDYAMRVWLDPQKVAERPVARRHHPRNSGAECRSCSGHRGRRTELRGYHPADAAQRAGPPERRAGIRRYRHQDRTKR
jgi:hypothetical protein